MAAALHQPDEGLEQVLRALSDIGVKPSDAPQSLECRTLGPSGAGNFAADHTPTDTRNPLVSCLMVTRGDVRTMAFAVKCYQSQTWRNRELVIVTNPSTIDAVRALMKICGVERHSISAAAPGLTLGELRNVSIARSSGDILIQWDDDDLSDPLRIELATSVLMRTGAAASLMTRWLLWWPARRLAAVSREFFCEGTMAVWRAHAPVYPAMARREDADVLNQMLGTRKVAIYDAPLQYIHAIHGRNSSGTAHFEDQLGKATGVFEGADYDAINHILARRAPVLDYERFLGTR